MAGNPKPTTLLLDVVTDMAMLNQKVDAILAEQQRAADRRAQIYESVADVSQRMAVMEVKVETVPQLQADLRELQRERDQQAGALQLARLLWMALAGVVGAATSFLLTRLVK